MKADVDKSKAKKQMKRKIRRENIVCFNILNFKFQMGRISFFLLHFFKLSSKKFYGNARILRLVDLKPLECLILSASVISVSLLATE
jgi:hypothetical protein